MSPAFTLRTGRLVLRPVAPADLADLQALKADPRVFAIMLGGLRSATRAAAELAEDIAFWGERGYGIWAVRDPDGGDRGRGDFLGMTGLMRRADGRGIALRFAFWPEAQGRGLAREAAAAALNFAHDRAGLARIVAVARESNVASRTLLGGLGMRQEEAFIRDGHPMLLYASNRPAAPSWR